MYARFNRCFILLCLVMGMAGCQPGSWSVSTDPQDTDLSSYQPDLISADSFKIQADVRIFTLFAFLNNVAGYDLEATRFTPERISLRRDITVQLAAVDPDALARWRSFYQEHPRPVEVYVAYVLTLGAPPSFRHIVSQSEVNTALDVAGLNGFNQILAEFYQQASLEKLFRNEYAALITTRAMTYRQESLELDVETVYYYLRLARLRQRDFSLTILPNPFDSHQTAYSVGFAHQLYLVDGPTNDPVRLNFKGYVQYLIEPMVPDDLAGAKAAFTQVYETQRDQALVDSAGSDVLSYVTECLARALDHRIRLASDPENEQLHASIQMTIEYESAHGLPPVGYFFSALDDYERDPSRTIDDFIHQILREYPTTNPDGQE